MTTISFDGRVAIVTGAGGGLGRAYALELARRGAAVVVNDIGGTVDGTGSSTRAADAVVDEIRAAGGDAVADYGSVADPEQAAQTVRTAIESIGAVGAGVYNGGLLRDRSVGNMALEEGNAVLDVHLRGAFHIALPAYGHMKEQGYGRFVFVSSNAGLLGNFGQANYGAAKMGLVGLSNVLAIEGAKYGIKSNVIAPVAATRMTEDLLGPFAERLAPELVAPMVAYLASDGCDVTHEVFSAGGGRFARFFVGVTRGWFSPERVEAEDIAAHLSEIRETDGFRILGSATEELQLLGSTLEGGTP